MYRMVTVEGGKTHLASAKESTGSKSRLEHQARSLGLISYVVGTVGNVLCV